MKVDWSSNKRILNNLFEAIGKTPLIKFNKIPQKEGINAKILGKIEFFNPTGSHKDRAYYEMITQAIKSGELRPGMEIIEASTGNAGIACAFVGRLLGYKVTIVIPEGMSQERMKTLRAYGANIIETPGAESDVDLCLKKIEELKKTNPGKYWEAGQYTNPNNVYAHYKTTGLEIWEQTEGQIDCFVASVGSGGTISGVGKLLKERKPSVRIYAVEPAEAPILTRRKWGSHRIEGIGDGFVPRNLDLSLLTGVVTTTSEEAITMAQRLCLEEGIFCGVSSGCNVAAAIKVAKKHPELKMIVTMINDSGQRYLSTELCGEERELEIPRREHPIDPYTEEQLNKHQHKWEIID